MYRQKIHSLHYKAYICAIKHYKSIPEFIECYYQLSNIDYITNYINQAYVTKSLSRYYVAFRKEYNQIKIYVDELILDILLAYLQIESILFLILNRKFRLDTSVIINLPKGSYKKICDKYNKEKKENDIDFQKTFSGLHVALLFGEEDIACEIYYNILHDNENLLFNDYFKSEFLHVNHTNLFDDYYSCFKYLVLSSIYGKCYDFIPKILCMLKCKEIHMNFVYSYALCNINIILYYKDSENKLIYEYYLNHINSFLANDNIDAISYINSKIPDSENKIEACNNIIYFIIGKDYVKSFDYFIKNSKNNQIQHYFEEYFIYAIKCSSYGILKYMKENFYELLKSSTNNFSFSGKFNFIESILCCGKINILYLLEREINRYLEYLICNDNGDYILYIIKKLDFSKQCDFNIMLYYKNKFIAKKLIAQLVRVLDKRIYRIFLNMNFYDINGELDTQNTNNNLLILANIYFEYRSRQLYIKFMENNRHLYKQYFTDEPKRDKKKQQMIRTQKLEIYYNKKRNIIGKNRNSEYRNNKKFDHRR